MGSCLSTFQGSKVKSSSPERLEALKQEKEGDIDGAPELGSTIGCGSWRKRKAQGERSNACEPAEGDVEPEVGPKVVDPEPASETSTVSLVTEMKAEPTDDAPTLAATGEGGQAMAANPVAPGVASNIAEVQGGKLKNPESNNTSDPEEDSLAKEPQEKEQVGEVASKDTGVPEKDPEEAVKGRESEGGSERGEEDGEQEEALQENVSLFGTGPSMRKPPEAGEDTRAFVGSKRVKVEHVPGTILDRHNVVVLGEGPEVLFLSHGFGTNQHIWGPLMDDLDLVRTHKVILWDLMGAYSTDPEGFNFQRYSTLHGYADDLLEVLDELEVQEITYIAHSVSGMIGVIASVERPQIFKRLIMIGASPRYLDQPGYKGGFTLEMLDQVFAAMQDNYKAWASGFAPMVVGEDVDSPGVREFCRSLFLIRPDIAFSTLKTIFMADMRHLLPQCKNQIHLLQTSRDAAVPWEPVQYMLDHFPNACVEVLPVAGHLPHLTHPKIVAEAVLRHLEMPDRPLPSSHGIDEPSHSGRSATSGTGSGRVNGNGELLPAESFGEY